MDRITLRLGLGFLSLPLEDMSQEEKTRIKRCQLSLRVDGWLVEFPEDMSLEEAQHLLRTRAFVVHTQAPVEWASWPETGPHRNIIKAVRAVKTWAEITGHHRPDDYGNEVRIIATPRDSRCLCMSGTCAACKMRAFVLRPEAENEDDRCLRCGAFADLDERGWCQRCITDDLAAKADAVHEMRREGLL
jgi:hypothetical protein